MSKRDVCPSCGREKERLGSHWRMASYCGYPELTENQKTLLKMFAALGTIQHRKDDGRNPQIHKTLKREWKARLIDEALGWLSAGVTEKKGRGYYVASRAHPWLNTILPEEYNSEPTNIDNIEQVALSETDRNTEQDDPEETG